MPTYDYACRACGHSFEVFEKPAAGGSKPCPKCGRKQARRQFSPGAGFIFKGSGFHSTDYKKTAPEPVKKKTVRKETQTDKEKKA